jgi:hypothetical protein
MKQRYYVKFETGEPWSWDAGWYETIEEAQRYCEEKNYKQIYSVRRFQGDVDGTGFKPHFNYAMGKWIETKSQYKAELKKNNYIEFGNSKPDIAAINQKRIDERRKPLFDNELVDKFRDRGHNLDDNLVETLKKESKSIGTQSVKNAD